jgi:hypothetical protein
LLANAAANGHQVSDRFHLERRLVGNRPGEAKLSELLKDNPQPSFVKVDVDGRELEVLESAKDHPGLNQTLWVVETHSMELEQDCIDWFSVRGFRPRIVAAAWCRLTIQELRQLPQNR